MKKTFFAVLVFLLSFSLANAQQMSFNLTEGSPSVNRSEGFIWVDVSAMNNVIVKDIVFDVTLSLSDGSPMIAAPIPARPVLGDNTTDQNKWTEVTRINDSVYRFHYWMADSLQYYLPTSLIMRKIMEFFAKFQTEIPVRGHLIITFSNFKIKGIDDKGLTIDVVAPPLVSIDIKLGEEPPSQSDSVRLQIASQVDKINRQTKLSLAYQSNFFPIKNVNFNLTAPAGFSSPRLRLADSIGRTGSIVRMGNDYLVTLDGNNLLPTNQDYSPLAEISFDYATNLSGIVHISGSNLVVTGQGDGPLPAPTSFDVAVDLGDSLSTPPPRATDSLFLDAVYLIDSLNHEVRVNVAYWGASWDTLSFDLNLPSGIVFSRVEPSLLSMSAEVIGSRVEVSSQYLLPKTRPNEWHHALSLVFKYDNARGIKRVIIYNTAAQREDTALVVVNPLLIVDIDFGAGEDTSGVIVKYFLTTPTDWFFLDSRPAAIGRLKLLLMMDNVVETTDVLQFRVVLPSTMSLNNIIPLDINGQPDSKLININFLSERDGKKYYAVVYSSLSSVLLPNYASRNPRAIMELEIEFTDICPGTAAITIDNIVASGLDGRHLSATKKTSLLVNFYPIFQRLFKLGDLDLNFGNTMLEIADWYTAIKIVNKEITPTCYQHWALDLNHDGVNDAYDLSILEGWLFTGVEDKLPGDIRPTDSAYVCGDYFYYNIYSAPNWELSIFDYSGGEIKQILGKSASGQENLEFLKTGFYIYCLKIGDKVMVNNFLIY